MEILFNPWSDIVGHRHVMSIFIVGIFLYMWPSRNPQYYLSGQQHYPHLGHFLTWQIKTCTKVESTVEINVFNFQVTRKLKYDVFVWLEDLYLPGSFEACHRVACIV